MHRWANEQLHPQRLTQDANLATQCCDKVGGYVRESRSQHQCCDVGWQDLRARRVQLLTSTRNAYTSACIHVSVCIDGTCAVGSKRRLALQAGAMCPPLSLSPQRITRSYSISGHLLRRPSRGGFRGAGCGLLRRAATEQPGNACPSLQARLLPRHCINT